MGSPLPPRGLLLSDDLIFSSRICGEGRAHGIAIQAARSVETLVSLAQQQPPRCVILDLANPGLSVPDLLTRLRAVCPVMPYVAAYGSHVDAARLHAAREAGCDLVWPRSKFVEELPQALPGWFAQEER